MQGFCISYNSKKEWHCRCDNATLNHIEREACTGQLFVRQITSGKFMSDKAWFDSPLYFCATEGVLLNKQELLSEGQSIGDWMVHEYEKHGETFFNVLRGSFCGLFYDKRLSKLIVFNDHIGDKMLFWTSDGDSFYACSNLMELTRQVNAGELDELGMFNMLTYGFSPTHNTIIKGIKRLAAGRYLRICDNKVEELVYHRFSNTHNSLSEIENIEKMDSLFRNAVRRVLERNAEDGLRNVFPLSAGLDSRMINIVARELTDANIENFTYSQTGHYDATIPERIAQNLGNKWHFRALDGGDYLKRLDKTVELTQMQISYAGAAQMLDTMLFADFQTAGVVPTGVGGDDIVSSPINKTRKGYSMGECGLGTTLFDCHKAIFPKDFSTWYANRNIYYLYVRNFECHGLGAPLMLQTATESYSPFMDVDFLEFVLTIPEKMRQQYRLYDKWVLTKYPGAAAWQHNNYKIGQRPLECYLFHRHIPAKDVPKRIVWYICRHLHIHNFYTIKKGESMNPIDSWLEENKSLREFYDDYYRNNIHLLDGHQTVKNAAEMLYNSKEWQNQILVMTLLSSVRQTRLIPS
ncbi:MAG: hypothetical protein IJU35_02670 [Paludibacteraceae bacterium]|nr:hypothetical protein [Paludibacteraceae bacterium]